MHDTLFERKLNQKHPHKLNDKTSEDMQIGPHGVQTWRVAGAYSQNRWTGTRTSFRLGYRRKSAHALSLEPASE